MSEAGAAPAPGPAPRAAGSRERPLSVISGIGGIPFLKFGRSGFSFLHLGTNQKPGFRVSAPPPAGGASRGRHAASGRGGPGAASALGRGRRGRVRPRDRGPATRARRDARPPSGQRVGNLRLACPGKSGLRSPWLRSRAPGGRPQPSPRGGAGRGRGRGGGDEPARPAPPRPPAAAAGPSP
ncbi:hypothetical protein VULLAG_LOCUS4632 [Vulpes lagopus]